MRNIYLTNDVATNLQNIRDYFVRDNIRQENLGRVEIEAEVISHLNNGVSNPVAIELFYQASVVFEITNLLPGKSRLDFRDNMTSILQQWLNHDFDEDERLRSSAIGKIFAIFSNFEIRMPKKLHDLIANDAIGHSKYLSVRDALHILSYHARTNDFISAELFDAIVKPIQKDIKTLGPMAFRYTLEYCAILDVMQSHGTTFGEYTPRRLYDSIIVGEDLKEIEEHHPRTKKAIKWFDGSVQVYSDHRHIHHSKVDDIRHELGQQDGVKVSDTFQRAAEGDEVSTNVRTGADFVVTFNDNAQVGVIYDTSSNYLPIMGQEKIVVPNGKNLLNSALVERDNPTDVVVRISSAVAKRISPTKLKDCLHAATQLEPGVYGINRQGEVVSLQHLGIAV